MQYVAKPVVVTAYQIKVVLADTYTADDGMKLQLENGDYATATKNMLARIIPKVGDYWVIQEDGYEYLNPKNVFERKYSPR